MDFMSCPHSWQPLCTPRSEGARVYLLVKGLSAFEHCTHCGQLRCNGVMVNDDHAEQARAAADKFEAVFRT